MPDVVRTLGDDDPWQLVGHDLSRSLAWWDNPRAVATGILRGRDQQVNVRYAALASHCGFEPLCCMPRTR